MNYSFKFNFHNKYYSFYDWLNSDNIKEYTNLRFIKVNSKILNDLINYQVRTSNVLDEVVYVYSDTFSFVACIFKKGVTYKVSSIMLKDEYKLKKIFGDLKYSQISYEKLVKRENNHELRYMEIIKEALVKEVELLTDDDEDKIKYLYYEWFDKNENNIKLIKKKMLNRLQKPITKKEKYIYELILASKN